MMQDESLQNDKKFEIIEQYHRERPKEKIYKIRVYMVGIMYKAEEKLRNKFQFQPNQVRHSNTHIQHRSGNQLDDDIFDQMTQEETHHNSNPNINPPPHNAQRSGSQQKPIKIYEDFKNRGKHESLKFHFNRQKQRITIIILAKYFFNELKLKEFDLLMVYQSFTKIWQQEYIQIMQTFIKYWKQFKNHEHIKLEFVAIDILGVTFQIAYSNKFNDRLTQLKRFRFRYSPFEFRQNPLFQEKTTQQIISFVEIHSNNSANVTYNDFYTSMRLGFIDDINNNSSDLWKRMIMRFWVFYQLHCLNRGISDFQQFNKKALGRVHLHSIRMKKFQLIFPFPLLHKNIIDQRRQGVVYFTFYLDEKQATYGENGLEFKLNVNIVEHYGILTFEQKKQIYQRLSKEDSFILTERQQNLAPNEIFEFWMVLKFDQKISKAFAKFQTIVSFFIDKISFNDVRHNRVPPQQIDNQKIIEIVRQLEPYDQAKNLDAGQKAGQFTHFHTLILELKHKHSIPSTYPNTNIPRTIDQTTFLKLSKKKRKYNNTAKKQEPVQKVQIPINQELKRYINQILKIKPLRQCYKQVMDYVQKVTKIICAPFRDLNEAKIIPQREMTLSIIITNICKLLQLGNHHSRKSQISIIYDKDPILMRQDNQDDLVAEITFNIEDLKIYWIKRLPEGYIIVRMFEKQIEIVKDLNFRTKIDINHNNIEQTSEDLLKELKNILMKEFATLQNMMI